MRKWLISLLAKDDLFIVINAEVRGTVRNPPGVSKGFIKNVTFRYIG